MKNGSTDHPRNHVIFCSSVDFQSAFPSSFVRGFFFRCRLHLPSKFSTSNLLLNPLFTSCSPRKVWRVCENLVLSWSSVWHGNVKEMWGKLNERSVHNFLHSLSVASMALQREIHSFKQGICNITNFFSVFQLVWDKNMGFSFLPSCTYDGSLCNLGETVIFTQKKGLITCFFKEQMQNLESIALVGNHNTYQNQEHHSTNPVFKGHQGRFFDKKSSRTSVSSSKQFHVNVAALQPVSAKRFDLIHMDIWGPTEVSHQGFRPADNGMTNSLQLYWSSVSLNLILIHPYSQKDEAYRARLSFHHTLQSSSWHYTLTTRSDSKSVGRYVYKGSSCTSIQFLQQKIGTAQCV